ncbi:dipeptide ABC transporter ATP-binding protein [Microbacterium rhizomatis]|uniref:ABC transporter ATP-binding protein n=1 Tax=Microbacterium rhizomatis TaxID=1631477 RepID=A0A5J5J0J2_9MICO|nr:ABC transporter ATP-binding protein [Microbacterium rhizomatis]KAA9107975.1 ABC transporter ATP-binding protein [Microbacterium rhizomatis]
MNDVLLRVTDLRIAYGAGSRATPAVRGVDFEVGRGEILAVVGESGSGKSTIAHSLIRQLPDEAHIGSGSIVFDGVDLLSLPLRAMRTIRGRRIGFVPQDPSHSLNPVVRVGEQIAESLRRHMGMTAAAAAQRAVEILREVGIPEPEVRARQYPHELSGGLRQRVLIGIAWACSPDLVIADEPTSALDATVQRHVLDRMQTLARTHGTAVVLVTHDLAVAADRAQRIVVMEQGLIVESGSARDVLTAPAHPYTQRLVAAAPGLNSRRLTPSARVGDRAETRDRRVLVEVTGLSKTYAHRGGAAPAVDDVGFTVQRGTTFSIVGESGSGKSTTARLVARIIEPDAGTLRFDDVDITRWKGEQLRQLRRRIQVVYQNPFGSLDPRMTVRAIVAEPLRAFGIGDRRSRAELVREIIERVRLKPDLLDRRPAQLSGGQRQRVAIARALSLRPEFLILDEPVSALDVSVQEQILQLLVDLQDEFDLTYLFISHDLGVIRQVSDSIAVMKDGRILEHSLADEVLSRPTHAYTRELIGAIPGAVAAPNVSG